MPRLDLCSCRFRRLVPGCRARCPARSLVRAGFGAWCPARSLVRAGFGGWCPAPGLVPGSISGSCRFRPLVPGSGAGVRFEPASDCLDLAEAVGAVDRPVHARLERDLRCVSALRADHGEVLAGRPVVAALVAARAADLASVVSTRLADRPTRCPAAGAAFGVRNESLGCVELLVRSRVNELNATVQAGHVSIGIRHLKRPPHGHRRFAVSQPARPVTGHSKTKSVASGEPGAARPRCSAEVPVWGAPDAFPSLPPLVRIGQTQAGRGVTAPAEPEHRPNPSTGRTPRAPAEPRAPVEPREHRPNPEPRSNPASTGRTPSAGRTPRAPAEPREHRPNPASTGRTRAPVCATSV